MQSRQVDHHFNKTSYEASQATPSSPLNEHKTPPKLSVRPSTETTLKQLRDILGTLMKNQTKSALKVARVIMKSVLKLYEIHLLTLTKLGPSQTEPERIRTACAKTRDEINTINLELGETAFCYQYIDPIDYIDGIEKGELAQLELKKLIQTQNIPHLNSFSPNELWRLVIDEDQHPTNAYYFDSKEPGYLGGVLESLKYALLYTGEITPDYLEILHTLATKNVKKIHHKTFQQGFPEKWEVSVSLNQTNCSPTGLKEFILKTKGQYESPFANQLENHIKITFLAEGTRFYATYNSKEERIQQATKIIKTFQTELRQAQNNEEKQVAMIRLVQDLDQSHLFQDGNIRTLAFVLLNSLLIRENLPPILWGNPNKLDGYSLKECQQLVKKGQEKFINFDPSTRKSEKRKKI